MSKEIEANRGNWMLPPTNRWAFKHITSILNMDQISRGSTKSVPIQQLEDATSPATDGEIEGAAYTAKDVDESDPGAAPTLVERTFAEMLERTNTDAIVVLHRGKVVYEKYFDGQTDDMRHILFSATKSYMGLIAAVLAHEGKLDPEKPVVSYLPEMATSAFSDATVRQVMDMSAAFQYSEEYLDQKSEIFRHMCSGGMQDLPPDYDGPKTVRDFCTMLQRETPADEHGRAFTYRSVNTDILTWIVERVLGGGPGCSRMWFQDRIWSKLGQESDMFVGEDSSHFPIFSGTGACICRDLARLGEMMRNGGVAANGTRVISQEVVKDIEAGGSSLNVDQFRNKLEWAKGMIYEEEDWSYRNQYWIAPGKAYTQIGIYGQWCWVDPVAELVIAKQSSAPQPGGQVVYDETIRAFYALGKLFEGKK